MNDVEVKVKDNKIAEYHVNTKVILEAVNHYNY